MYKTVTWTYLFALFIVLLLPGCSAQSNTTYEEISELEAIDAALESASMSRPELSGSQVTPSHVQAERMTLGEAVKRIDENNRVCCCIYFSLKINILISFRIRSKSQIYGQIEYTLC